MWHLPMSMSKDMGFLSTTFVKSLNINESFIGKEIELVPKDSVAFPE